MIWIIWGKAGQYASGDGSRLRACVHTLSYWALWRKLANVKCVTFVCTARMYH